MHKINRKLSPLGKNFSSEKSKGKNLKEVKKIRFKSKKIVLDNSFSNYSTSLNTKSSFKHFHLAHLTETPLDDYAEIVSPLKSKRVNNDFTRTSSV